MKKRILLLALGLVLSLAQGYAVLKEKDLARTLGVLRAELLGTYERQQAFMAVYEQQGAQQHKELVRYMQQCEQIGLMLYSQTQDNTFDMAYACQQAVDLHRSLRHRNSKLLQYDRIINNMDREIERLDALINTLKSMPPVISTEGDNLLTAGDSILLMAIDSLAGMKDSITQVERILTPEEEDRAEKTNKEYEEEEEKEGNEEGNKEEEEDNEEAEADEEQGQPLYLQGKQLRDRADCLVYAQSLRDNMQRFLETMKTESSYYETVKNKVEQLNSFAQSRYKMLQDNIFINGGRNYFRILSRFSRYFKMAQRGLESKYSPLKGHSSSYSEWRGMAVLFISVFIIQYLAISLLLSYICLRLFLPKKWRTPEYRIKRGALNMVVGTGLFAVIVMVIHRITSRNFIQMGTELIINFAWLLEIILLSLYIRLRDIVMRHAVLAYLPLVVMAFIVIIFRIVLLPNSVINLIFPLILLLCSIWQLRMATRRNSILPTLDVIYVNTTTVIMIVSCIASWFGYTLMAVQIMIWWMYQLAAIMTITCLYDLMEMFEERHMIYRISPELKQLKEEGEDIDDEIEALTKEMRNGDHFGQTWIYDLVNRTLVPILAVLSIPFSIYQAAKVFEMTTLCQKVFFMDLVNVPNLIRLSLSKVCVVAALWFIFRYLTYSIRSIYTHYSDKLNTHRQAQNHTLVRNVITILTWGIYFITALVILNVPKSGISLVTAGLATGLGFAMQDLIENFFYGISLMAGRLHVGDFIECDGIQGKVESITYQSTQVITIDGCVIAFLNKALFSKNFKNMTRNHRYELIKIPVGVAYGTDVELVRKVIIEAITPACKAKNKDGSYVTNMRQAPLKVAFVDFGDSSINLAVCVWMLVEEKIALTSVIKEIIYNTLNENHIQIPFPQRDLHVINLPAK